MKLFFGNKGEIETFLHKQMLRAFIIIRLALQEMLKRVLCMKVKEHLVTS